MNNSECHEKRSSTRYLSEDSSAVMLTPDNIISFCILDISKSGMAFCYDGKGLDRNLPENQVITFFTEGNVSSEISVQIISDTELDEETFSHLVKENRSLKPYLRRCGIKFKPLSQDQEDSINEYIQHQQNRIPEFISTHS